MLTLSGLFLALYFTFCRSLSRSVAQSNKSLACLLCARSLTGWSNSSLPSFLPERSYCDGNNSFMSARPLMLKPPEPLMLKPLPLPEADDAEPLILRPPPPLVGVVEDGNSSTPLLGRLLRNDLVLSREMLFRANRSARSSAFLASMAWLRRWCERGLVCAAFIRSAFSRFAAAALARTLAGSFTGRDGAEVVMDVSLSVFVTFEGNSSILSECRPPPCGLRVDDVVVSLKSSLPAFDRAGRSVRSR